MKWFEELEVLLQGNSGPRESWVEQKQARNHKPTEYFEEEYGCDRGAIRSYSFYIFLNYLLCICAFSLLFCREKTSLCSTREAVKVRIR